MKPRVLIVGTVPYNKKSTSRAFESYFCNWEKVNLAQIFSNTKRPVKGHCGTLFQITDQRLLKRRFSSSIETGVIFYDKDLSQEWSDNSLEVNSSLFSKLYSWGSKKRPIVYLARKQVWRKKYWCTEKLNNWLEEFDPQCVFLSFSDDFFIPQIALYVAERFNIPIISSIGDDYYFNKKLTLSPFYYIYKSQYRKLIRNVFQHKGNTIYIGDKIKNKYNFYFGLNGETVYLNSNIKCKEFCEINKKSPKITYCGNIRLGRNNSLYDIGNALGKIDSNYRLDVYSNETDQKFFKILMDHPNIRFHGSIPYSKVEEELLSSDIIVVVEGFKKSEVEITRFSLSTKVADSLATGSNVFAYGSIECGAIEYMQNINCGMVCIRQQDLLYCLKYLINNVKYQKQNYENAAKVTRENHNLMKNSSVFESVIDGIICKEEKQC